MLMKVRKAFNYCADGITPVHYEAGAEVNVNPRHAPGLVAVGYLEADDVTASESKELVSAPEKTKPLAFGEAFARQKAEEEAAAAAAKAKAEDDAAAAKAAEKADWDAGYALAADGEVKLNAEQSANEVFVGGYRSGLADWRRKLEIIEAWEHLDWSDLRSLAGKLSDDPITTKESAIAAVKNELAIRAGLEAEAKKD